MNSYPKSHLKAASALTVLLAIAIGTLPAKQEATIETPVSLEVTISESKSESLEVSALTLQDQMAPRNHWVHIKVKRGDNLARIFQRVNLQAADLQNIIDLGEDVASLRKILHDQEFSLLLDQSGRLLAIRYQKTAFETLLVERVEDNFATRWQTA